MESKYLLGILALIGVGVYAFKNKQEKTDTKVASMVQTPSFVGKEPLTPVSENANSSDISSSYNDGGGSSSNNTSNEYSTVSNQIVRQLPLTIVMPQQTKTQNITRANSNPFLAASKVQKFSLGEIPEYNI